MFAYLDRCGIHLCTMFPIHFSGMGSSICTKKAWISLRCSLHCTTLERGVTSLCSVAQSHTTLRVCAHRWKGCGWGKCPCPCKYPCPWEKQHFIGKEPWESGSSTKVNALSLAECVGICMSSRAGWSGWILSEGTFRCLFESNDQQSIHAFKPCSRIQSVHNDDISTEAQ